MSLSDHANPSSAEPGPPRSSEESDSREMIDAVLPTGSPAILRPAELSSGLSEFDSPALRRGAGADP